MSNFRIADRYAKSLLDISKEKGNLDEVKSDMTAVLETLSGSKELSNLLANPIVPSKDKKEVLSKVFSNQSETSRNFLLFVTDKGREGVLGEIASRFIKTYDKLKGIARASVTSAIPLNEASMATIKRYLSGALGVDQIELETKIDPSIIGGMLIRYEDKLLDLSIAKELREIRKEIIYN